MTAAILRTLDSGSHVRPPGFRRNAATEHLPGGLAARRLGPDLRRAYALARQMPQGGDAEPLGHRLVWVHREAFGGVALAASPDAFAIVGRHTQCGVALLDDPFVALRHLLVRSIALPSGGVALRILDLHTSLGFALPDGTQHTSIFAEGPIAIGVGDYALVALPPEVSDDELPLELPSLEIDAEAALRDRIAAVERALSPYRASARPRNCTSRITLMPRPVMVGEPLPPTLGRLATGGRWALTLERAGRSATVTLSAEDLARGVIVGRSEKCHSEQLRRITDVNTSRTHVLILREGDSVHAYDLASTQGTFRNGMPAKRTMLGDAGTFLSLGRGESAVRLVWRSAVADR